MNILSFFTIPTPFPMRYTDENVLCMRLGRMGDFVRYLGQRGGGSLSLSADVQVTSTNKK